MAVPALTAPGRPVGRRPKREGRCGSRNPCSRAHPTCSSYLQSALGVPSLHSTSILLKRKIRRWRERHMSRRRTSKQPTKDSDSLETKFKKDKHSHRPCLRKTQEKFYSDSYSNQETCFQNVKMK